MLISTFPTSFVDDVDSNLSFYGTSLRCTSLSDIARAEATGLLTLFNSGFGDFLEFFLDANKFVTEPRGEFEFQVSRGVAHLSG